MKIATQLWIGFTIISTLSIFNVIFSIAEINNLNAKFNFMVEDRYQKVRILHDIDNQLGVVLELAMDIILRENPLQVSFTLNSINAAHSIVSQKLNELKKITRTERGHKLLTELSTIYKQHLIAEAPLLVALNENRFADARKLMLLDLKQDHLRYKVPLGKLLLFQTTRITEITQEAYSITQEIIITLIITSIGTLALMIVIIIWVIASINRPVVEIAKFLKQLGSGEVHEPMRNVWAGEFDDIRKHINFISYVIRAISTNHENPESH